jgi:hypothetical protein
LSGGDLIIAAPWLVFAGGLTAIGWRLAAAREHRPRRRAKQPGAGTPPRPGRPGSRSAPRGTGAAGPDGSELLTAPARRFATGGTPGPGERPVPAAASI